MPVYPPPGLYFQASSMCYNDPALLPQVLRIRERRPSRLLFSAWLQSAYIEAATVELKRADLDKVNTLWPAHP